MEYLKNYTSSKNVTIKLDGIKEKYLCKLCDQILYKPKCTKCGCNFCGSCLDTYLDTNEKMCPNCKDCEINAKDSFPNWSIEKKLLKVKIICPNVNCNIKAELGQMESHLNECKESQIKCCMFSYGCENSFDSNLGIKSHLQDNLNDHFEMLKNRVESFQDKIQQMETESNDKLIQNKVEIEVKIEQGAEELREKIVVGEEVLREQIVAGDESLREQIVAGDEGLREQIVAGEEVLREQFVAGDEGLREQIVAGEEVLRKQIIAGEEVLRQKVEAGDQALLQHIVKIEEENKALEKKMKEEREEWKKEMWNLKEEMTKIMNEKFELSKTSMTIGEYYVAVDGEAKVKFTGMSKKTRDTKFYTDDFIINKYWFNIGMCYFSSNNLIRFNLYIVPGCYDAKLEWPLKNRIEMVILRKDGKVYQTLSFQYSESLEEWKQYYEKQTSRGNYIPESLCYIYYERIINSKDEVNLIIKMLK